MKDLNRRRFFNSLLGLGLIPFIDKPKAKAVSINIQLDKGTVARIVAKDINYMLNHGFIKKK